MIEMGLMGNASGVAYPWLLVLALLLMKFYDIKFRILFVFVFLFLTNFTQVCIRLPGVFPCVQFVSFLFSSFCFFLRSPASTQTD